MASPMAGPGALASSNGQGQAVNQTSAQQAVQEFTGLAQQVQQMAQKYPEFVENAAQVLKLIEKGLAKVAGNPSRTPERQAPPVA